MLNKRWKRASLLCSHLKRNACSFCLLRKKNTQLGPTTDLENHERWGRGQHVVFSQAIRVIQTHHKVWKPLTSILYPFSDSAQCMNNQARSWGMGQQPQNYRNQWDRAWERPVLTRCQIMMMPVWGILIHFEDHGSRLGVQNRSGWLEKQYSIDKKKKRQKKKEQISIPAAWKRAGNHQHPPAILQEQENLESKRILICLLVMKLTETWTDFSVPSFCCNSIQIWGIQSKATVFCHREPCIISNVIRVVTQIVLRTIHWRKIQCLRRQCLSIKQLSHSDPF